MNTETNIYEKKPGFFTGYILLVFILFMIFSLGFLPLVLFVWFVFSFFVPSIFWMWLLLPFILYLILAITLFSELLISGLFIKAARLRYKAGVFEYSFKDKNAFKWILVCSLYTPFRKIMEIIPVGGLKNIYFRLLGMKIGKNTLIGGVIKDPCVTSFGHNTTMGEYAIIYGHIQDFSKGTLTVKPVIIGNNCVIGAGAILMPGAIIEDGVTIATGAVVTSNQILKAGRIYAGIPAKEIVIKKKQLE
jgi:acetyltransferase-like isoleucine patch superfamily enzyme